MLFGGVLHVFALLHLLPWYVSGDTFRPRIEVGQVLGVNIKEGSGLVASRTHNGVLWAHEDKASGSKVRLHAMTTNGDYLGHYNLEGVYNQDMEDMAMGPGPVEGVSYIYLGDIGDNWKKVDSRRNVTIYRVMEPVPPVTIDMPIPAVYIDTITLNLPGEYDSTEYRDSETLLVDPILGEIYVLRKQSGNKFTIWATEPNTIYRSGSFEADLEERGISEGVGTLVGGDITQDGREVLIKHQREIYYLTRNGDYPLSEALLNLEGFEEVEYEPELQGEGIAFASDNSGFYTFSEVHKQISLPLYFHPRNGPAPSNPLPPRPTGDPLPTTPAPTTLSPTRAPTTPAPTTRSPTPGPTPLERLPLDFTCNDLECEGPLQRCQGDCDTDDDCAEGLECFQREANDAIPTCIGGSTDADQNDYCVPDKSYVSPTLQPTPTPAPEKRKPQVDYVCNNDDCTKPLQQCEGDCDSDSDCAGGSGSVCFFRAEAIGVPGCRGGRDYDNNHDFCILKKDLPMSIEFVCNGFDCDFDTKPLQQCQADCDEDEECGGDLVCFSRTNNGAVPGCMGGSEYDSPYDFCVRPCDLPGSSTACAPTMASVAPLFQGGGLDVSRIVDETETESETQGFLDLVSRRGSNHDVGPWD